MPKHLMSFLLSRSELDDDKIAELFPELADDISRFRSSEFSLPTLTSGPDTPAEGSLDAEASPDTDPLVLALYEMGQRHPLRAAVLEFRTVLRVLLETSKCDAIDSLTPDDYRQLTKLLAEIDRLAGRCRACPVGPEAKA